MAGIGVGYYLDPPSEDSFSSTITEQPSDGGPNSSSSSDTDGVNPSLDDVPFDSSVQALVAVVIDDMGWSNEAASIFSIIRKHLTFAVLPERPHSRSLYEKWKNDSEFIVHMPMEPQGYPEDDPGKRALMTDMSEMKVRSRLRSVLDRYPDVSGMNNHMGSQFTQNTKLMGTVMDVLKERGLFYLDSRTSSASVALEVGQRKNIPVLRNQVFLDNEQLEEAVERQLAKLVRIAREEGRAIGIGHFQSTATARVLRQKIPEYRDRGIQFVGLSRILREGSELGTVDDESIRNSEYSQSDDSRL